MLNENLEEENVSIEMEFIDASDVTFSDTVINGTSVKVGPLVTSEILGAGPLVGYVVVDLDPTISKLMDGLKRFIVSRVLDAGLVLNNDLVKV